MNGKQPDIADRYLGCLLGMAIGDAFGVGRGGSGAGKISETDHYLPRIGPDGSVAVPAGQFSTNTELALCLLETLVTSDGFVDPEVAIYRFENVVSRDSMFVADPGEVAAILDAAESESFQSGGIGESTAYAGPAVRAIPIALAHALSDLNVALITREVMRSVLATDANPEVVNGGLAVAHAIRLIIRGETPPELIKAEVLSMIDEDGVARAIRQSDLVAMDDGTVAGVVATGLDAFYRYPAQIRDGLKASTQSGASAHLGGALAGALIGAHIGASNLPPELVDGLEGRAYLLMAAPALLRVAQMRAGLFFQLQVR